MTLPLSKQAPILSALSDLENELGIVILHACESGSRAWGFASQDSDWDVRFIYAQPSERYLSIRQPRETISRELPGDLDISGWDLRMALAQLSKSNGAFLEWLGSPIIYKQDAEFAHAVASLSPALFRPKPLVDHYLGLARSLRGQAGEGARLNGKKYLYVLRATLAASWVVEKESAPPVLFAELLPQVPEGLRGEIDALIALKAMGSELDAFPVSEELQNHVDQERARLAELAPSLNREAVSIEPVDGIFRATLNRLFPLRWHEDDA